MLVFKLTQKSLSCSSRECFGLNKVAPEKLWSNFCWTQLAPEPKIFKILTNFSTSLTKLLYFPTKKIYPPTK